MCPFRILDMGGKTSQGNRDHQEDRYICILPEEFPTEKGDQIAFFAVYDGHGSDEASECAQQSLHHRISNNDEFEKGHYEKAITLGLKDIDDELYESFASGKHESAMCGCTVALCLLNLAQGSLLMANLGDSSVILGRREHDGENTYKVERLSRAHKPADHDERRRIQDAGGTLNYATGDARLGTVNITRALGDLQLKRPLNEAHVDEDLQLLVGQSAYRDPDGDFVSRVPFTVARELRSLDKQILILASDGVTDALDDNDDGLMKLVGAMEEQGHSATDISRAITELVGQRKNSDNCTCIVVFLSYQD
ncbi:phosphatase [Aspergillus sp. HF37]|nr:phosphatase [Aspergillus sp. HF37]